MTASAFHQGLRDRLINAIPHSRELGVEVQSVTSDSVEVMLPFRDDWIGDSVNGLIHPGVTTTLVDGAFGLAVMARLGKIRAIATLDLRMDYLRPALKDLALICRAECYRITPHIAFARATVWQSDASNPVAFAQAAFMLGTARQGVSAEASS
jgi:uncharacterized protein (TIGR00369 family)